MAQHGDWRDQERKYAIYCISKRQKDGTTGGGVYIGLTGTRKCDRTGARPNLKRRLQEHEKLSKTGSKCPLHRAMRKTASGESWSIRMIDSIAAPITYYKAKELERVEIQRNRKNNIRLLNRSTLSCG